MKPVLSLIKPSKEELAAEIKFSKEVAQAIQKSSPPGCDVVITGSVAKRTFLRDGKDLDIFVLFNSSTPKSELEGEIKKIIARAYPSVGYQISYAEHPYVRFRLKGRVVDLVPAYRITKASELLSAVDRSVLHTKFVKSSLKEKQIDEVLLLKAFLKANSLYGAEIKVQGFSGYLCELLIIKFGSFKKLAQEASKWSKQIAKGNVNVKVKEKKKTSGKITGIFIDLKKYYKNKKDVALQFARFGDFVIIDPTDKNRNVAAAVSAENLSAFSILCKKYLKKPSANFFLRKPESFDERLAKLSKDPKLKLLLISLPRPDVVDDVLWGQLRKLIGQLESVLGEFKVKEIFADDRRHIIRIAVALGLDKLPPTELVKGPPLSMKEHVLSFKSSHARSKFSIKKKTIYATVKRKISTPKEAVMGFFKEFQKVKSHLSYQEEMIILEQPGKTLKKS
ncbi:CCA tRNA nucleotidyltransferase [Candidatus Micrarchaeota archaeon]|nr:CCA tRNA nucleotidyltransferase [Candidatus Micrarchaeota archaeon]